MIAVTEHELDIVKAGLLSLVQGDAHPHVSTAAALLARLERSRPSARRVDELVDAAMYAVVDFRGLAREAGETDPVTSPALRAADRLADALVVFTEKGARR